MMMIDEISRSHAKETLVEYVYMKNTAGDDHEDDTINYSALNVQCGIDAFAPRECVVLYSFHVFQSI